MNRLEELRPGDLVQLFDGSALLLLEEDFTYVDRHGVDAVPLRRFKILSASGRVWFGSFTSSSSAWKLISRVK